MLSPLSDATAYKQLPKEISQPVSFSRVLVNLLGAVGVVFIFNLLAIIYFENDTQNRGDYIVREKWRMVNTMEEPVSWLILGDSSANQGIVPPIINEVLGGKSINLAMIADWTLLGDAWMLQSYIERFGPPSNVIIGHVYDTYERDFAPAVLAQSSMQLGSWEHLTPQPNWSLEEWLRMLIIRYAPLYHRNVTLQQVIERSSISPDFLFKEQRSWLDADGYMSVARANPELVNRDYRSHIFVIENFAREFEVSDINQQAINEIIRLADFYEINIYFLNSPLFDQLYANETFQGHFSGVEAWLKSMTARSEYTYYIERPFLFPADELQRVDHTYNKSAHEYTSQIAQEIARIIENNN